MDQHSGLVLRTGPSAGTVIPFKLPLLALGSGTVADVQAADLEAIHCLLVPTPAGPTIRSFSPSNTLVNGTPVTAALLKQDDVLTVGASEFTVQWTDLVPLTLSEDQSNNWKTIKAELDTLRANIDAERVLFLESKLATETMLRDREAQITVAVQELNQHREYIIIDQANLTESLADLNQQREKFILAEAELESQQTLLATARKGHAEDVERLADEWKTLEQSRTALNNDVAAMEQVHAAATIKQTEIDELHRKATEVHQRTRDAAAKHLREQRAKLHAEREDFETATANLKTKWQLYRDTMQVLDAERTRFAAEMADNHSRIHAAKQQLHAAQQQLAGERLKWEAERQTQLNAIQTFMNEERMKRETERQTHLNAVQQQVIAERQKWDAERRAFETALQAQQSDLEHREATLHPRIAATEHRLHSLHAEVAGLEQRASHARQTLADLESRRDAAKAMAPVHAAVVEDWTAPVPLNPQHDHRTANDLMNNLRLQEQEVTKERQRLYAALHKVAAEREAIHDRELRVAEEQKKLESVQQQWHDVEAQTVTELELLAKTLSQRESRLSAMEKSWMTSRQMDSRIAG